MQIRLLLCLGPVFLVTACGSIDEENRLLESRKTAQMLSAEAETLLYLHEQVEEALAKARTALGKDPHCLDALRIAADCLDRQSRPEEAMALLETEVDSAWGTKLLMEEAARLYMQRNQPTLAIRALERAIEATPWDADLFLRTASLQAASGKEIAARESFTRALDLGGNRRAALVGLATMALRLNELEEAERILTEELGPEASGTAEKVLLGVVKCEQKKVDEGMALFRQVLGSCPEADFNLALALEKQDRKDEAEALYQQTLHQQPTYAPAAFHLGCLRFLKGERQAGLALIDQAIEWESSPSKKRALEETRTKLVRESTAHKVEG